MCYTGRTAQTVCVIVSAVDPERLEAIRPAAIGSKGKRACIEGDRSVEVRDRDDDAVQPGAQSGRADLALSAQPLARQLGVYQPDRHHGCLRDGLEPVRHQPRPDPLALRGRLGSSFARFMGGTNYVAEIEPTLASRNLRRSV